MLKQLIPSPWKELLTEYLNAEEFAELDNFVSKEYAAGTVYPEQQNIFNALNGLTPDDIKVVILGQDPYHEPNQAHGLSFSVLQGPYPPSLCNIFKELQDDMGLTAASGNLSKWKEQGVLLLNTVLTVRAHQANSHKDKGWEQFVQQVLNLVMQSKTPKVFILWGSQAQNTFFRIYNKQPNVRYLKSPHPSPLSSYRGFFGSKPFSSTNHMLISLGSSPIDWNV